MLDVQRIQDADVDPVFVQSRFNGFMVAAGGLHDVAGIFASAMMEAISFRPVMVWKNPCGGNAT